MNGVISIAIMTSSISRATISETKNVLLFVVYIHEIAVVNW